MRQKLLEQMYDNLSEDDKRLFVRMTMQDKDHTEIMQALQRQSKELESIKKAQSWWLDLGSNVAGNAIFDGAVYLFSKLMKRF